MNYRPCIIIPYYGKWPEYLGLFFKGCSYNQWLDILLVTDLSVPANLPENVKYIHLEFDALKELIREKTGVEPVIKRPYKLCDFRPAYGDLFSNYLTDYDFWGWGDLDLIYGNLETFVSDHLPNHDVISLREHWVSGSFCLIRNRDDLNLLYKSTDDYQAIFTTEEFCGFDECGKKWGEVNVSKSIFDVHFPVSNFTLMVREAEARNQIKVQSSNALKESISEADWVKFEDGTITNAKGESFAAYHYITEKKKFYFGYPKWHEIPDTFYVNKTGFFREAPLNLQNRVTTQIRIAKSTPKYFFYYLGKIRERLFRS